MKQIREEDIREHIKLLKELGSEISQIGNKIQSTMEEFEKIQSKFQGQELQNEFTEIYRMLVNPLLKES